jgi:acetyltransferase-like isoleucine patch superfamily enzyme
MSIPREIIVPRLNVADSTLRLVKWTVESGERVEPTTVIAILETSKATFEVAAETDGHVHHQADINEVVSVGQTIALLTESPEAPNIAGRKASTLATETAGDGPEISEKARPLMAQHGLTGADFPGRSVVRKRDVEALVATSEGDQKADRERRFGDEVLDLDEEWDAALASEPYQQLRATLTKLRRRMKARFDRHVSTGELLYDRWDMARDHGFGEGSSIYDACLLLGDVRVGKHCWVGPFTVLDGAHSPLEIGDYSSIGSGTQIYTHNTIQHVLTGGQQNAFHEPTRIGRCVFVSPMCVIGAGTIIGDHSFVAAGSYVEGRFPSHSYIAGNPATRVGRVVVEGDRAHLLRDRR